MTEQKLPVGVYPEEDKHLYEELFAFIATKEPVESSLIAVLHRAQNLFGYIPEPAMVHIAEKLNITSAEVYGVVTFYSYFTLKPKGKYNFSVCLGTACYVKGAQDVLEALEDELGIKAGDTTDDRLFSIIPTRCLGDCARAPIVMVNETSYGNVTPESIRKIVRDYRKEAANA